MIYIRTRTKHSPLRRLQSARARNLYFKFALTIRFKNVKSHSNSYQKHIIFVFNSADPQSFVPSHAQALAQAHAHENASEHARTHEHEHAHSNKHTRERAHAHEHKNAHTHENAYKHSHAEETRTQTCTCTPTRTHTRARTQNCSFFPTHPAHECVYIYIQLYSPLKIYIYKYIYI